MSGRWSGSYTDNPMPGLDALPTRGFVLEITSERAGRFRGTIQDDPAAGTPEASIIEGHVSSKRVEFVKRMPVLYLFESGRARHMRSASASGVAWSWTALCQPPPSLYEGEFGAAGKLAGRWWLDKATIPIPSRGERFALDMNSRRVGGARRQAEPVGALDPAT